MHGTMISVDFEGFLLLICSIFICRIVSLMHANGPDKNLPLISIVQDFKIETSIGFSLLFIFILGWTVLMMKTNPRPGSDLLINLLLIGIISIIIIVLTMTPYQLKRGPLSFEIHPDSFQLKRQSTIVKHIPFSSDVLIDISTVKVRTRDGLSPKFSGIIIKSSDAQIKIRPQIYWTLSQVNELWKPIVYVIDNSDVRTSKKFEQYLKLNLESESIDNNL
jgi:hypothetical protein